MAPLRTRHRTCRQCRYSLAGLPRQCTCPECGLYDDGEYDYRSTRQRLYALPRHLLKELREAQPWFVERYLPSIPNATRAASILLYAGSLCAIGLLSADAITGQLGILHPRPRPMSFGPSFWSEAYASTLRWAPLFLAAYAFAVAFQGVALHRIRVTGATVISGVHARVFGIVALSAALALVALFAWLRYLP